MLPYSLQDMADDGLGLLTALGIEQAHIVGSSMGGMIAQLMAIGHPARVRTLTSMMSSTGEPAYGRPTPAAQLALFDPRPSDREGYIATSERALTWSSRRYANLHAIRELAAQSYDRAHYPAGVGRQLGATLLAGSRADALKVLNVPALVIHGTDDTLVDPSGGRRTAELIRGASLLLIADMGHDRPRELWDDLCDAIEAHTQLP
jgi:pimeloyl-ACP methyl ester carboxylesterase